MPTLIPAAAGGNLHPNQWQYETPVPIKNERFKLSTATSAIKTSSMSSAVKQTKQLRFRENAAHIVGKRVSFHGTIAKDSLVSKKTSVLRGGLLQLSRTYNPKANNDEPAPAAVPFTREFTHSTHQETKQAIAYSNYINHLISPHVTPSATSPRDSFSTLLLHQAHSSEVSLAYSLYDSMEMKEVRRAIDREVGRGRLIMRSDRDLNEVLLQQELMGVIMSYSVRWLGVGLEVVLSERGIGWEMTNKHELEKIVSERILSDPAAQRKYTRGKCRTPSGKYETKLREYIHHHALIKMLTLVTYLDRAKQQQILNDDPCLFDKQSNIKSSNAILASICRICFARKELIVNHMAHLGITVSHVQNPLDEYEYYIRNLSIDLKDGVRLAKMVEILTGRSVLNEMRLPASSRANKIHNMGAVLTALHHEGVGNIDDITATHIVDAHQPRILQLLWNTIVHFQIGRLDEAVVKEEIESVEHWIEQKRLCSGVKEYHGVKLIEEENMELSHGIKVVLLKWCQTICSFYNVPVENYAESFSDGKVLCLLVSFYHPTLLSPRDILPTAIDLQAMLQPGDKMDDKLVHMAFRNERYNLSMVMNRLEELGGIPRLFSSKDFLMPPDEKSLILCVSFLFSRLTKTSAEINAAKEMQQWWNCVVNQKKRAAAKFLLRQWRQHREIYFQHQRSRFAPSVQVLEIFYLRNARKFKELATHNASRRKLVEDAVKIQSYLRMKIALKQFRHKLSLFRSARLIQSCFRTFLARKMSQLLLMHKSSAIIQKNWRSQQIRSAYIFVLRGVIKIQSLQRTQSCRSQYKSTLNNLIMFQSLVRSYLVISRLSNAVTLNFGVRSFFTRYLHWRVKNQCRPRSCFVFSDEERDEARVHCLFDLTAGMMSNEAIVFFSLSYIQSVYRGYRTRRDFKFMHLAATKIQQTVRRYQAQLAVGFDLIDIITVQCVGRRYITQMSMRRNRESTITIQRIWRGYSAKLSFGCCLTDIIVVQSIVRRYIAQKQTLRQRAAVQIERIWRGCWARDVCCRRMISVIRVQSAARCIIGKLSHTRQRKAIIVIQRKILQMSAKLSGSKMLEAVVKIQSFYRGHAVRMYLVSMATSATCIQSFARRAARERIQRAITAQGIMTRIRHTHAAMKIQISYRNRLLCRCHQYASIIQRFMRGCSSRQSRQLVLAQKLLIQSNADCSNVARQHKVERTSPLQIKRALGRSIACHSMQHNGGLLDHSSVPSTLSKTHEISMPNVYTEGVAHNVLWNEMQNAQSFNLTSISHASEDDESVDCVSRLRFQQCANNQEKDYEDTNTVHAKSPFCQDTPCENTERDLSSQSKCRMNVKPQKSSTDEPLRNQRRHVLKENKSPQTLNSSSAEEVVDVNKAYRINGNKKETEFGSQSIFRPLSHHTSSQNRSDSLNKEEVQSVRTRSKVSILRSLENAKPESDEAVIRELASSQQIDLPGIVTRSRSSSFDIDCIVKALEVVGNGHLMSEVKQALNSLEYTTRNNKNCCGHFIRLKGEIALCFLITSCNRSAPHLEIILTALQILTNVSKHQSTAMQLAKQEVVEVILYACQMYRDKSNLLALSSSLLNRVLKHGDCNILTIYSTSEQKMRINGILSLSKKRAFLDESSELFKGITSLENVIQMLNQYVSR